MFGSFQPTAHYDHSIVFRVNSSLAHFIGARWKLGWAPSCRSKWHSGVRRGFPAGRGNGRRICGASPGLMWAGTARYAYYWGYTVVTDEDMAAVCCRVLGGGTDAGCRWCDCTLMCKCSLCTCVNKGDRHVYPVLLFLHFMCFIGHI